MVNSSLTRCCIPKALLPFFCPTKPPLSASTQACMMSIQETHPSPHQIKFDTDSQKFLIDSGVSAHLWHHHKDFISYCTLSPHERKMDQVLGVSGEAVAPEGIRSVQLRIEDDLNDIHTIHLHDVQYLLEAPINIFVPQVFSQQHQAEGDSKASCSISANSISLQRIQHYHCENGRFADKAFVDDVWMAHQTITFYRVGAHHQNRVAERRIRDITENAHTSLLHAAHRSPKAIAANLWPQAIKHVVNVRNSLPRPGKTESPLSKFAGTSIQPNLKDFHPFGCLVYVLQAPLQTRSPFPKWGEHSRIGIFLCHSPHHVSSVRL